MTKAQTLQGYMKDFDQKRNAWLGQIVFFSVPESTIVKEKKLKRAMTQAQLESFTPSLPRASNVFRRVSSAHNMKRVETNDPDVFEDYRTEEVLRQDRRIVKDIVVRQTNIVEEELKHQPQVRLEFDNSTAQLTYWWLESAGKKQNQQALNLAEIIAQDYFSVVESYNCTMLRGMIRNILESSRATMIQKKAYFISNEHAINVAGLQLLSSLIPDIEIVAIPLVDTQTQRDMIRQAFLTETLDEIDRTLVDLDKYKGQEISSDQFASILVAKDTLKEKTKEYKELLGTALDDAELRIKVYDKRVASLLKYVKE